MKEFFYGIQDFTEGVLFVPFNYFRELELESWWSANAITWMFIFIGFVFFFYWMKQLAIFNSNEEEDRSQVSHSFLGKQ